jgi:hypothetical protein
MDNQFFFKLNPQGRARKFKEEVSRDFYSVFVGYSQKFISMEDKVRELKKILPPHDFRGLAGDWYHDGLGMSTEQTATALGDAWQTVKRRYLRNDRHIVTPVITEANRLLELRDRHKETRKAETQIEDKLCRAEQRAERAENLVSQLLEQLRVANEQISSLRQQFQENHDELLEKIERRPKKKSNN